MKFTFLVNNSWSEETLFDLSSEAEFREIEVLNEALYHMPLVIFKAHDLNVEELREIIAFKWLKWKIISLLQRS